MTLRASSVGQMRVEYRGGPLREEELNQDAFEQFGLWFRDASEAGLLEPNAMSLATVSAEGRPSLRTVLLKHWDERGFVFFTNLESRKAREITVNPHVSLLLLWLPLARQLSIRGRAQRVSTAEALAYFAERPFASQIAAWASPQSRIISARAILEAKWEEMKEKFKEGKVPLPSFWGGLRVVPQEIEFWQGRKHRLHDRFLYTRAGDGSWKIERLAP
jgi:pyridoxamine 5'-phosphate oxidase